MVDEEKKKYNFIYFSVYISLIMRLCADQTVFYSWCFTGSSEQSYHEVRINSVPENNCRLILYGSDKPLMSCVTRISSHWVSQQGWIKTASTVKSITMQYLAIHQPQSTSSYIYIYIYRLEKSALFYTSNTCKTSVSAIKREIS